ncbi:hypothetical protein L3Y34_007988 [Caenorhabditis briggsae]|uniref:Uncharacterized protein n=1 Tax=Caenorhabditis briggsae TaxID=6238 RepID=A0AAE9D0G9_CAEBR|nr:hypothetical protein L3Y34_007988 [Caenorhabditis briggsae]
MKLLIGFLTCCLLVQTRTVIQKIILEPIFRITDAKATPTKSVFFTKLSQNLVLNNSDIPEINAVRGHTMEMFLKDLNCGIDTCQNFPSKVQPIYNVIDEKGRFKFDTNPLATDKILAKSGYLSTEWAVGLHGYDEYYSAADDLFAYANNYYPAQFHGCQTLGYAFEPIAIPENMPIYSLIELEVSGEVATTIGGISIEITTEDGVTVTPTTASTVPSDVSTNVSTDGIISTSSTHYEDSVSTTKEFMTSEAGTSQQESSIRSSTSSTNSDPTVSSATSISEETDKCSTTIHLSTLSSISIKPSTTSVDPTAKSTESSDSSTTDPVEYSSVTTLQTTTSPQDAEISSSTSSFSTSTISKSRSSSLQPSQSSTSSHESPTKMSASTSSSAHHTRRINKHRTIYRFTATKFIESSTGRGSSTSSTKHYSITVSTVSDLSPTRDASTTTASTSTIMVKTTPSTTITTTIPYVNKYFKAEPILMFCASGTRTLKYSVGGDLKISPQSTSVVTRVNETKACAFSSQVVKTELENTDVGVVPLSPVSWVGEFGYAFKSAQGNKCDFPLIPLKEMEKDNIVKISAGDQDEIALIEDEYKETGRILGYGVNCDVRTGGNILAKYPK